jgi:hypothetical protein
MTNQSKAHRIWFTTVCGVIIGASALVSYSFAQSTIPWPTGVDTAIPGRFCTYNSTCPPADCTPDSTVCAGQQMAFHEFQGSLPFGSSCFPGDWNNICFWGSFYPCAYYDYLLLDANCTTPQCFVFPLFRNVCQ